MNSTDNLLLDQAKKEGFKGKINLFLFKFFGFIAVWQEQINNTLFQRIANQQSEIEKLNQTITNQTDQLNKLNIILHNGQSNSCRLITEIDQLLNNQVEYYQPLYGIPAVFFSSKAKRDCSERVKVIENYFNKDVFNLRILDIGSSLGYFCFYLADRGAFVDGWEHNEMNFHVSNLVKQINQINTANFYLRTLDLDTIKNIPYDNYDCVLALNIFHHINDLYGLSYCQDLIQNLLEKSPILIVELANSQEDSNVYWKDSLPVDELAFFAHVKNCSIKKIGDFDTHLSETKRSMYAVTNTFVTVNNHKYLIDKLQYKSYKEFALTLQRRFIYTKKFFIKKYRLNNEDNFKQIINEINILNFIKDKSIQNTTRLIEYELDKNQVTLVLDRIHGILLSDSLPKLQDEEKEPIIDKILAILCELESIGIFHNDIRTWNIMIDTKNNPYLIDFGLSAHIEKENNLYAFAYLVDSLIKNIPESDLYDKKTLPEFTNNSLYLKYISPIMSDRIKSFRDLMNDIVLNSKNNPIIE